MMPGPSGFNMKVEVLKDVELDFVFFFPAFSGAGKDVCKEHLRSTPALGVGSRCLSLSSGDQHIYLMLFKRLRFFNDMSLVSRFSRRVFMEEMCCLNIGCS
jgi:hypothetical protein